MTQTANDELVLLTSYFNLAGGRRQDTPDTFKVEPSVPSDTSPEGVAALYIVTEASAGGHMGPRARRMAADVIARAYGEQRGTAPAPRLKAALRAAHEQILDEYDGHVSVGTSVIAVEGHSIYLAQAAPGQVYVLHEGRLHSITAAADETSPYARALGATNGPRISLFRDEISAGDVLALCSSWFAAETEGDEVRDCFSAETADEIAESLLDLSKSGGARDCTGIVIEAADASDLPAEEEEEDIPDFAEQVDSAVQALAGVGRMLWTELRTIPPEDQVAARENGRARGTAAPATPAFTGDDDIETEEIESPRASRRRDFFSGARPFRRSTSREEEPDVAPPTTRDYEARVPYDDEFPLESGDASSSEPEEDPYRVYREQATDEVPAVSDYVEASPEVSEEPPYRERVRPPSPSTFHDQATSEMEFPIEQTRETPAVSAEPMHDPALDAANRAGHVTEESLGLDEGAEPVVETPEYEEPSRRSRLGRERGSRRSPIRQSTANPEPEPEPQPARSSEINEVNARLGAGQDMSDVVPPVQAFPDTSTEPSRIYATSKDIDAVNKRPRRFGGIARPVGGKDPLQGPAVIRPGMGDLDLRRPVSRPAPPAAVWGAGIIFLLLVAVAGYYWYKHRHAAATVNPYPALVRNDIKKANAAGNPATQDQWLARAHRDLVKAQQNNATTAVLQPLSASLASTSDRLHKITRVTTTTVLADFSKFPNARPTEIATSPGLVFVLDAGRKSVFSVTPNSTTNPTQIVTAGETDTGYTIGIPTQIATDGATALVLDDKNVIVRDLAGNKSATSLTPGVPNPHYVQMDSSDPDIYLLDTASSQVWRYPYGVSGYTPPANQYFDTTKPPLGNAISFVYDGLDLYILKSDGTILKFDNQANAVKFTPNTRTPLNKPVAIYSDQGLKDLWIADPTNKRIVEIGKDGTYVRTYASNAFGSVTRMVVGPAGNTVYLLSGSKLLSFNLVH